MFFISNNFLIVNFELSCYENVYDSMLVKFFNTSTQKFCAALVYYCFSIMEEFLRMVEHSTLSQEVATDVEKLKFFTSRIKIWDYVKISSLEYQKLLFDDKSSILKNYYVDMSAKYSVGTGIFIIFCFLSWFLFKFSNAKLFFLRVKKI